ncbi:MAG: CHRD domain-containing protein [Bradyrhizobium sp.]|nr:MAG: CHRD domain-containing protein [Bradyrhizobium sp.]
MSNLMRSALCLTALAAALAFTPALADTLKYKATLSGPGETPPNDTKGTGTIEATYDSAAGTLSWTGSYSGLTGPAIAAHFHGPAAAGTNSGVLVPVDATASPFSGSANIGADVAKDFADGMVYFNIHTSAHKPGEIRGQLAPE